MTGVQTDTVNRVTVSSRNIVRTGYFSFILYVPNVSVHPRRTLCAVGVQRLVRIFILVARLFHSQLEIVYSPAESGRISGQADLYIFYPNVSVHLRATCGA